MIKFKFRNDYIIWVVGLLLLLLMTPLVSRINFMQNDDWVYYKTVENFLKYDFKLAPMIGSTFFTQGFFGYIFSKIFGLMNLPFLTLAVSVGNFVIISFILNKQVKISILKSILLGLLLFLSPLHFYSTFGFMTENFVLFFLLVGIYFTNEFFHTERKLPFVLSNLFFILGFFTKQYLVVAFISIAIVLLVRKFYKYLFIEILITLVLILYYYIFFPKTGIIENQSVQLSNLFNLGKSYPLIFISFIYFSAMLLPLVYLFILNSLRGRSYSKITLYLICAVCLAFVSKNLFLSTDYYLKDFPYIGNTFDRKGFFPGDLDGNKYSWRGIFDVMRFWDLLSVFGFSTFAILAFSKFKFKLIENMNFISVFFVLYLGLFLVSWNTYDRYFLPLIATGVLALSKYMDFNKFKFVNISLILFLLFLGFIDFQFSKDYVGWQNYVWNKSNEISKNQKIAKDRISSSRAWNKYYNVTSDYDYKFSFDSLGLLENPNEYNLIEAYKNYYKFSIFINPYVYLYSK